MGIIALRNDAHCYMVIKAPYYSQAKFDSTAALSLSVSSSRFWLSKTQNYYLVIANVDFGSHSSIGFVGKACFYSLNVGIIFIRLLVAIVK